MCLLSPKLTGIMFATLLPVMGSIGYILGFMKEHTKTQQSAKAVLGQIAEEAIGNYRTVKAFATEGDELVKYHKANIEAYHEGVKLAKIMGIQSFVSGFGINGVTGFIIWYGAILYKDGEITLGSISAFLLYMINVIFLFIVMGFAVGNLYKVSGAAEKIMEMMKYTPTVNSKGGDKLP